MATGSETAVKALPPPARRRSKRLRKKLRIDEFKEYGFALRFRLSDSLSAKARDDFWAAFTGELIAQRGLAFSGNEDGYVTKFGRGSATQDDRHAVERWLKGQPAVAHLVVGPLEDAWYRHEDGVE